MTPGSFVLAGVALAGLAATVGGDGVDAVRLADVTAASGIDFVHRNGARGDKHLPETMGAGVAALDVDLDGRWDLYFVDSGPLPGDPRGPARDDALYRNLGEGRFAPAPRAAGTVGPAGVVENPVTPGTPGAETTLTHPPYGMGGTAADFDADGWSDLYLTSFGANILLRNNGDGTFSNVTAAAGVGDDRWSTSAAWADLDLDGLPDLYVANYVVYDLADPLYCGDLDAGIRSYCHVDLYEGDRDVVYRNLGDGRFADISASFDADEGGNGLAGKGLGVVVSDLDADGWPDVYVANDTTPNALFLNRGDLRFAEAGLAAGVAVGDAGNPQAGMGVDVGDVDGDGIGDIVVTNFSLEPANLYRIHAPGFYMDDGFPLGLGEPTYPWLGFGVALVDLDADGDRDLAVANGHILDTATDAAGGYAQPNQVLVNRLAERRAAGDTRRPRRDLFRDASPSAGDAVTRRRVSRGLASLDADGDGLADLVVTNSAGPAELLANVSAPAGNRLVLRLRGRDGNRDALGARVTVIPRPTPERSVHDVRSASSYLSQGSTDLYVGLGDAAAAEVQVRWPGGTVEHVGDIDAGRAILLVEGRGAVASVALRER